MPIALALAVGLTTSDAAGAALTLPRPLAMGGAYGASGSENGTLTANPAGMGRYRTYAVEVAYLRLPENTDAAHVSIVDTRTRRTGVGVGYTYVPERDEHDGRLGFAYPIVPKQFWVGARLRYLFFDREEPHANVTALAGDAGIVASPFPSVFLGATAHNAMADPAVPETATAYYVFSLAYDGPLEVAGDLELRDGAVRPAAGIEVRGEDLWGLRGGWRKVDEGGGHAFAGGLAFLDGRSSLDLAIEQVVNGGRTVALSVRGHF